jgi:hypothetical protein
MAFQFNDGGRAEAGFKGTTGDCTTRAIAIATGTPYQQVYDKVNELGKSQRITKRRRRKGGARKGIRMSTIRRYMKELGWEWTPTMFVGAGCKVHLRADELPAGRLIVRVSKHMVAMIDGVINDAYDCSRDGTRCVYGYFSKVQA